MSDAVFLYAVKIDDDLKPMQILMDLRQLHAAVSVQNSSILRFLVDNSYSDDSMCTTMSALISRSRETGSYGKYARQLGVGDIHVLAWPLNELLMKLGESNERTLKPSYRL